MEYRSTSRPVGKSPAESLSVTESWSVSPFIRTVLSSDRRTRAIGAGKSSGEAAASAHARRMTTTVTIAGAALGERAWSSERRRDLDALDMGSSG
jgi:hypothetical protein